ncbi:MAG TPA: hypothetical protein VJS64_18620, partial [Pyrinomonadaceae bacterium]|nr:hypothetical protein [Pyrinomonadaceae bacterium]
MAESKDSQAKPKAAQPNGVMQATIKATVKKTGRPGGWSWNMVRAGELRDSFDKLQIVNSRDGWAATEAGCIAHTTDNGKTWNRERLSLPLGAYVRSMWISNAERAWLVIQRTPEDYLDYEGSESWVKQTADSGRTWDVQLVGGALELHSVFFADEQVGWVVGGRRTKRKVLQSEIVVMRTTDQGEHWTDLSEPLNQILGIPPNSDAVVAVCKMSQGGIALLTAGRRLIMSTDGSSKWA